MAPSVKNRSCWQLRMYVRALPAGLEPCSSSAARCRLSRGSFRRPRSKSGQEWLTSEGEAKVFQALIALYAKNISTSAKGSAIPRSSLGC